MKKKAKSGLTVDHKLLEKLIDEAVAQGHWYFELDSPVKSIHQAEVLLSERLDVDWRTVDNWRLKDTTPANKDDIIPKIKGLLGDDIVYVTPSAKTLASDIATDISDLANESQDPRSQRLEVNFDRFFHLAKKQAHTLRTVCRLIRGYILFSLVYICACIIFYAEKLSHIRTLEITLRLYPILAFFSTYLFASLIFWLVVLLCIIYERKEDKR